MKTHILETGKKFLVLLLTAALLSACVPLCTQAAESIENPEVTQETAEETHKTDGVYTEKDGSQRYYKNGVFTKATGIVTRCADGKKVYVKNGVFTKTTGIVNDRIAKKQVYVEKGVFLKKTGVAKRVSDKKWLYVSKGVFKKATGAAKRIKNGKWVYVKKGVFKKHTGVVKQIGTKKWIYVLKGVQTINVKKMVLTKADQKKGLRNHFVEAYAKAVAAKVTKKSMTEEEKIWALFEYTITHFQSTANPRIPHYTGTDWHYVYAYDMFGPRGGGNCLSFGAAFAFLAKAGGIKNVYACNSGAHGWTEINGRVYDPEQYHDTNKKIYNTSYSSPLVPGYRAAVSDHKTNPFKRIKMKAF